MKKNVYLLNLLIAMFFIAGCGSQQMANLSKSGKVKLEKFSSQKVYIPWADVYQTEKGVFVDGVLKQRTTSLTGVPVHIDITVLTSDGMQLKNICSEQNVSRNAVGKGIKLSNFSFKISESIDEGTIVRVAIDHGRFCKNKTGSEICGKKDIQKIPG